MALRLWRGGAKDGSVVMGCAGEGEVMLQIGGGLVSVSSSSGEYRHGWAGGGSQRARGGNGCSVAPVFHRGCGRYFVASERSGGGQTVLALKPDRSLATVEEASEGEILIQGEVRGLHIVQNWFVNGEEGACVAVMKDGRLLVLSAEGTELGCAEVGGDAGSAAGREIMATAASEVSGVTVLACIWTSSKEKSEFGVELVKPRRTENSDEREKELALEKLSGMSLDAPAERARPATLTLSERHLTILWSNNQWDVMTLEVSKRASVNINVHINQGHTLSRSLMGFQASKASAAAQATKGSRKRTSKALSSNETALPLVMTAMANRHVAVGGVSSNGRPLVVALDCMYGCAHDFCEIALEGNTKPSAMSLTSASIDGEDFILVGVGKDLYSVQLRTENISLASVVGSLAKPKESRGTSASYSSSRRQLAATIAFGAQGTQDAVGRDDIGIQDVRWGPGIATSKLDVAGPPEPREGNGVFDFSEMKDVESKVLASLDSLRGNETPSEEALREILVAYTSRKKSSSMPSCILSAVVDQSVKHGYWAIIDYILTNTEKKIQTKLGSVCPALVSSLAANNRLNELDRLLGIVAVMSSQDLTQCLKFLLSISISQKSVPGLSQVVGRQARRFGKGPFENAELPLHSLVLLNIEPFVLFAAFQKLNSTESLRLLEYLNKWMKAEEIIEDDGSRLVVPMNRVVLWISTLIDARFTQLALMPDARGILSHIAIASRQQVKAAQKLSTLGGAVSHLKRQALLPPPMGSTTFTADYTIELLNL